MDVTSLYQDAVRRRRATLGLPTPAEEVLPRSKKHTAFTQEARATLSSIQKGAQFLRDIRALYLLEDGPQGMSEAERDDIDSETQRILLMCGKRIDGLRPLACGTDDGGIPTPAGQLAAHQQAVLKVLCDQLSRLASVFDELRGHRLRQAASARDQRLGSAAAAAGTLAPSPSAGLGGSWGGRDGCEGSLGGGGSVFGSSGAGGPGGGGGPGDSSALEWGDDELLAEADLGLSGEGERAQLEMENEALANELEAVVEQAREAESSMLEISKLSHLFATKVEQQSIEIDQLAHQAEQTSGARGETKHAPNFSRSPRGVASRHPPRSTHPLLPSRLFAPLRASSRLQTTRPLLPPRDTPGRRFTWPHLA